MDYILPAVYFFISIFSFIFSWKGFVTKKVIFKKGVFGTKMESSEKLAFVQALLLLLLALATAVYGYFALRLR